MWFFSLGGKRVWVLWAWLWGRREAVCSMVCFYGCFTKHWCSMDDVPAMGCSCHCGIKSISTSETQDLIYTLKCICAWSWWISRINFCRLVPAMAFTVTSSHLIQRINPRYGLRIGLDGNKIDQFVPFIITYTVFSHSFFFLKGSKLLEAETHIDQQRT